MRGVATHLQMLMLEGCVLGRFKPTDVAKAAELLATGAILGRSFAPHEAHIPYLLQFKAC